MAEQVLLKSKEVRYQGVIGDIELRLVKLSDNIGDGNFHLKTVKIYKNGHEKILDGERFPTKSKAEKMFKLYIKLSKL